MFDSLWAKIFGNHDLVRPGKEWVRQQLAFLGSEFGEDRLITSPIVEPTDAFFPDPYDGSPGSLQKLFQRICDLMEVPISSVSLQLFQNNRRFDLVGGDGVSLGIAGGTYHYDGERFVIRLDEAKAYTPMQAVATLAHELSHARLMGEQRIDPTRWDNELLTDLCAVYFGFGVFRANVPAYSPQRDLLWPGTNVGRTEYMSTPMYGYALALIAALRFEEFPAWARHLRGGARAEFKAAMHQMKRESEKSPKV